jgi:hypothetical protein
VPRGTVGFEVILGAHSQSSMAAMSGTRAQPIEETALEVRPGPMRCGPASCRPARALTNDPARPALIVTRLPPGRVVDLSGYTPASYPSRAGVLGPLGDLADVHPDLFACAGLAPGQWRFRSQTLILPRICSGNLSSCLPSRDGPALLSPLGRGLRHPAPPGGPSAPSGSVRWSTESRRGPRLAPALTTISASAGQTSWATSSSGRVSGPWIVAVATGPGATTTTDP